MDPQEHAAATAEHLQRQLDTLTSLGERIARLARALRLPLQSPAEVEQALVAADADAPGSRAAVMRAELRGLLVLRYEQVARIAQDVGAQATLDILETAHQRMLQKGFGKHAPGVNLRPQFDGL